MKPPHEIPLAGGVAQKEVSPSMHPETNARRPPERIGRRLYEYVQSDGQKTYHADVVIDGRQTRQKLVASSRVEARRAQADLVSKDNRKELVAPAKKKTVREVGDEWLRTLNVKPRTREAYEYHLKMNVYPRFGDRRVLDVSPQDVADLVVWLRNVRKVGVETSRGALRTLSALLAHAVWKKDIPWNPVTVVPQGMRPKHSGEEQSEEHRYLSTEERDRLLGAMTATYRPVAYVAVWTGLRESELLGLTWADINLKEKKIHVRKQLSRPTKDRPAKRVSIKTRTTRSVDIDRDPDLVTFLREHKLASKHSKDTDYIFSTESGQPLHFRNLGKAFSKAADKAKLNTAEGERKLRFHDLRRTYASVLLKGRLDPAYVAQQMGHSVAVLYATYAGLINAEDQPEKGLVAIQRARAGQS